MSENKIPIPARLYNAADGGHVAGAADIIDDSKGKNQQTVNQEVDNALSDRYTKSETYNKNELNNLITTPSQEYENYTATDQTTDVTDVLPATGAANTTYRVGNWDGTQYDDSVFSEYAWNGSAYVKLSTKSQVGEVYDISLNHADTKYADLAAALGTNGANVPVGVRKGGMSVKYVQSSDNKYVQYRLEAKDWSINPNDWVINNLLSIKQNPEYVATFLDGDKKLLKAITKLGLEKIFIPTKFLGGLQAPEFDEKVDKEEGKSLIDSVFASFIKCFNNPEYIFYFTDKDNKVVFGIKRNGKTVLYNDKLDMIEENVKNNIPHKGKKLIGVEYFGGWDGTTRYKVEESNAAYHSSPLFNPNSEYYDPDASNYENWYDYVYFKEGVYPPTHATFYLWFPQFAPTILPSRKPLLSGGFRCDTVSRMEEEIELASQYNIDYFLFCFFTSLDVWNEDDTINEQALINNPLNSCIYNYLNASNKGLVKMAIMIETESSPGELTKKRAFNLLKYINNTFVNSFCYQYIDGFPLLGIYGSKYFFDDSITNVFGNFFSIFNYQKYRGNGSFQYIGGLVASSIGQSYNTAENSAYISQVNNINKKEKYFINVQVGNDTRPWLAANDWSTFKWVVPPTKNEFKQALLKRMNVASKFNGDVSILIYCWNELGEGGWLLPTEGDIINGQVNMSKLEAIKEAKEEWLNN